MAGISQTPSLYHEIMDLVSLISQYRVNVCAREYPRRIMFESRIFNYY